ncbi:hypothetical protein [Bradyrhizobium elkanii]|uniref:hypothetical protein n=1 Tax=Bradyrhizobium elkanii TaxID=29448 RepID=UPI00056E026B|nr:hypothetical protein [Bradyrhizobium elkanii]WLA85131.1 hypothetical protein QNJ99_13395 [Bradyrhizobium elkanii]
MKDAFTLAMFAAKVLCLFVFVSVLKPDGCIGAVRTTTGPTGCMKVSGNAGMWAGVLPVRFASQR